MHCLLLLLFIVIIYSLVNFNSNFGSNSWSKFEIVVQVFVSLISVCWLLHQIWSWNIISKSFSDIRHQPTHWILIFLVSLSCASSCSFRFHYYTLFGTQIVLWNTGGQLIEPAIWMWPKITFSTITITTMLMSYWNACLAIGYDWIKSKIYLLAFLTMKNWFCSQNEEDFRLNSNAFIRLN